MTTVAEIMTTDVQTIAPQDSLQCAAQLMERLNVGSLPVCDGRRLLGIVTDRDITVRGTAAGMPPASACVSDVMSDTPQACSPGQNLSEVLRLMGDEQVRRLPVVDANNDLIGIVALGDLATTQRGRGVQEALRDISTPSEADGGPARS